MNPDDIKLNSLTKNFEYTKHSRELDALTDIEQIRHVAKCYAKLYLKQQEVLSKIA